MLDEVKIVIVTHNRLEVLQQTIESIRTVLQESVDILVVDNHSDDGTIDWLGREGLKYMSCDVQPMGYGCILDMVLEKFIRDEDMLLLQPGIMLLPSCVENMMEVLRAHDNIGAVAAQIFYYEQGENLVESWTNAYQYSTEHLKDTAFEEIFDLNVEAVLFKNALLRQIGEFEKKLLLPNSVMADIAFEGIKGGWQFWKLNCAYCFFIPQGEKQYEQLFGQDVDREYMKAKWGMNYFNKAPNVKLLEMIACAQETEMNVLEIGCDCGVNLLYIKNKYKNAHLYGVEINPYAAEIASHIAQTQVADIEECALDFEGIQFDYIIFGDVLEHLREPEKVVAYCRKLLNNNGRIIASIPNLMHYSVLWGLLNGYFSYTDTGLLDRTHIHMFTFNEIMKMFIDAGYEVEAVNKVALGMSPESRQFVDQLLAIAPAAEEFMYTTFQYLVMVRK